MKKYNIISFTVLLAVLFAMVSCKGGKTADSESKEEENLPADIVELRADQIKLAKIETGQLEMRSLSGTLKVSGIVATSPCNLATVCMPMGGFIKSSSLMPGNAVRKGQTLAIIENNEFIDIQQNYLETKSRFEYAEAEYKRHNELYKEDVYSQKTVQQVKADYKSLKTQLKGLEQKLRLIGVDPAKLQDEDISSSLPLVSPISGYVKTVNVNIGKYVNSSDVLFEIVNTDDLYLELTLFEKDADKILPDQNVRFFINNETEQHKAVISQTARSIDSDKTFKVYAGVMDVCKNVIPGMYVNAIIETSANQVLSIPSEAIVSFGDKYYIFVFEKNKEEGGKPFTEYRMVEVTKGVNDAGYTEIILSESIDYKAVKVVIKGAYNLLSAMKNAGEMSCG